MLVGLVMFTKWAFHCFAPQFDSSILPKPPFLEIQPIPVRKTAWVALAVSDGTTY